MLPDIDSTFFHVLCGNLIVSKGSLYVYLFELNLRNLLYVIKDSNDKLVIDKAKTYIKKVKEVCNKKYLKSRGETNKGELSAFFAAVSPQRIFSPINELLRDIDWENYTEYNSQYKLLNDINKDITMNNC